MKMRPLLFGVLICLAAGGVAGCQRNIVRAAPPSVAPPPTEPQPQPEIVLPPIEAKDTPALESLPPPAPDVPEPAPAHPRAPSPAEAAKPKEPEAPEISPQLSPAELDSAQRRTTDDIRVAERN